MSLHGCWKGPRWRPAPYRRSRSTSRSCRLPTHTTCSGLFANAACGPGAGLAGLKMGLTSLAKMKQMGVETPIYGFLLDDYRVAADSELSIAGLIHPRVEAEIALVTRHALRGPGCTA